MPLKRLLRNKAKMESKEMGPRMPWFCMRNLPCQVNSALQRRTRDQRKAWVHRSKKIKLKMHRHLLKDVIKKVRPPTYTFSQMEVNRVG